MKTIEFKSSDFRYKEDFLRIGDLINFEGPELTIFEHSKSGAIFLFDWVDGDTAFNRWLLYEIKAKDVLEFYFKKINHLEMIQRAVGQKFYIVDLDRKNGFSNIPVFELLNMPSEYLPNPVYFDTIDCPRPEVIKSYLMDRISSGKHENRYIEVQGINLWRKKEESHILPNSLSPYFFPSESFMKFTHGAKFSKIGVVVWIDIASKTQSPSDASIYATFLIKEKNAYALAR